LSSRSARQCCTSGPRAPWPAPAAGSGHGRRRAASRGCCRPYRKWAAACRSRRYCFSRCEITGSWSVRSPFRVRSSEELQLRPY
jgi:hypothetical protein